MKTWSSLICASVLFLAGCAEGAKLVQDTGDGGLVTYPFKGEQGAMLSSFRSEALALMRDKCSGSYTIVREGETRGRARADSVEGSQEMIHERRWGIQFQCK
ncbi:MAG TPA: hypothetical protein VN444_03600 [Verrucomicrobiae bacterium]|jgi:hypothetical protein|nr:hypothetical protein [Verrucomicrobiae bacterium]